MSRIHLSRALLLSVALMLALSLLVACGGDGGGGGGDIPVPSGADRLAEEDASAEDLDAADVDISDAKAAAYRISDASFDDVSDFYENEVEDDGWTVDEHAALGDLMIAVLHQDDDLVVVTAMTGAAAKEQGELGLGDLEVDLDDLADDDIIVVGASFTCNEDSIDTCIEAMGLGL
ncbi:MAG: hypothetical protein WEC79_07140 [Thermomicrobiales bacterium]